MGEKIIVGPIDRGLKTDRTAFVIDNDSFPVLINAYQWRGQIKRKRGTSNLSRLMRFFNSANAAYGSITTFNLVAGAGNILTSFSLQANGNIVPGSVTLTVGANVYTDPGLGGTLVGAPAGTGTINYATGAITISGGGAGAVTLVSFLYYPDLPVMGIEDLNITASQYPDTIAFDTEYSYFIIRNHPFLAYDISFYRNPNIDTTNLPGYVRKNTANTYTPVSWNGEDYQQFWTVNYQGAFWATNGINIPFVATYIGMQFAPANTITFGAVTATTLTVTITNCPLVIGDFVFVNEWVGVTEADSATLNFQTGYVTACAPNTPALAAKTLTITFPNAAIALVAYTPGIVQYLTNRSDVTKDCIRYYDGDPTGGNATNPTLTGFHGWVNFCPPLSREVYGVANTPEQRYYLVGARMIVPFKDRLLFFGPVIQSSTGSPIYLQDTVVYSQNGTPYYTASFTGDPSLPTTDFHQILVPDDETATVNAFWEDQTGFGGYLSAGVDQPIITVSNNGDVLIVGFSTSQTKLVYSGDDILPFNFFLINSELGSGSTFSAINIDKGVMTRGSRGFIITGQTDVARIDLDIPDEVFEISLTNNGNERMCSQRDYINEWVYFTFNSNLISGATTTYKFPNKTLQYNYRDDSWAAFFENYTTYGTFRKKDGLTWGTLPYGSWLKWNTPWNSGSSTPLQIKVLAGNQQGFLIMKDSSTDEAKSLYIQNISSSIVTSPDHSLNNNDYIIISDVLGTIGTEVNGKIFSVANATQNTFQLNPTIGSGTYLGTGLIQRMYIPFIQTKQFPSNWAMTRKTRIGVQQYLLSRTNKGQITLLIYLSMNDESPYNNPEYPFAVKIVPDAASVNNSLIYSTILYTCPESTNLGLTPANVNLNMPTAVQQQYIWHRINTSLIGDTVQLGFTLNDEQMRDTEFKSQFTEIELHGFTIDVSPSQLLS